MFLDDYQTSRADAVKFLRSCDDSVGWSSLWRKSPLNMIRIGPTGTYAENRTRGCCNWVHEHRRGRLFARLSICPPSRSTAPASNTTNIKNSTSQTTATAIVAISRRLINFHGRTTTLTTIPRSRSATPVSRRKHFMRLLLTRLASSHTTCNNARAGEGPLMLQDLQGPSGRQLSLDAGDAAVNSVGLTVTVSTKGRDG
jgi:hypothetical protein